MKVRLIGFVGILVIVAALIAAPVSAGKYNRYICRNGESIVICFDHPERNHGSSGTGWNNAPGSIFK